jgi:hypothetical protein
MDMADPTNGCYIITGTPTGNLDQNFLVSQQFPCWTQRLTNSNPNP